MNRKMFEVRVYINTNGEIVIAQEGHIGQYAEEQYVVLEHSQAANVAKWLKDVASEIKYAESIGHDFSGKQEEDVEAPQPELPGLEE